MGAALAWGAGGWQVPRERHHAREAVPAQPALRLTREFKFSEG